MARWIALCLLLAAPLGAQVFPRLEKPAVAEHTGGGDSNEKTPPDDDPVPDKPQPEPAVDGAAVLKRYDELLKSLLDDKRGNQDRTKGTVNRCHESVRDYLTGRSLLKLGYYSEAEKTLEDVGHSVKKGDDVKSAELKMLHAEIRAGKAYHYRMVAAVMQHYTNFSDDEDYEKAWKKATADATKIIERLQKALDQGKVDEAARTTIAEMNSWLVTEKSQWRALWSAEKQVRANPAQPGMWIALAGAVTSHGNNNEYTPHFLKQRAAITLVKEYWPRQPYVVGGLADSTLALNYAASLQLEDAGQWCEPKEYHSMVGRVALKEARKKVDEIADIVGRLAG